MKLMLDKYKILKTQKQYIKIIVSNIVNRFGDSIDQIAFVWIVYEITHSAVWSTIMFGINILPTICIQPFAGALVECMKKRNIMVLCDMVRGIFVASIAFLYMNRLLTPWILLIVTFLNSTVEALRVPAGLSIVPKLLDAEYYETGIALNSSLSRAMELVGKGCAGFIIAMFGVHSAIFLDAMTFLMSAVIISTITYKEDYMHTSLTIKSYFVTLKEGFVYISKSETLIMICIIGALLNFTITPLNSVLPSYIDGVLNGNSETLSMLSIGISVGSIIGSFSYPIFFSHISKRQLMIHSFTIIGLFFWFIILVPQYLNVLPATILVMFLFMVVGIVSSVDSTYLSVYITSYVDSKYMARVGGFFNACLTSCVPVASILIAIFLQFTNYLNIMLGTGVICLFITLIIVRLKKFYLLDDKE